MKIRTVEQRDVVIIGDGLVGRSIARELAERGITVDILDAGQAPATLAAAGMLSPLAESSAGSPFQMACLAARDLWLTWAELLRQETGTDLGLCTRPSLFPAYDTQQQQFINDLEKAAEIAGEEVESLDPKQVYDFAPPLAKGAVSGLLLKDEPRIDPYAVMQALDASLSLHGVLCHHGRQVEEVRVAPQNVEVIGQDWHLECQHVIVAAGAWCSNIKGLGLENLVHPVRGQMLSFNSDKSWSGLIRRGSYYAFTRGKQIFFGATHEEVGFDDATTDAAARELRDAAEALIPKLAWRKTLRHWSGLRPGSVDGLPIVGRWQSDRITVATGTFRSGILLAPWLAKVVADLLESGESVDLPASLTAARFQDQG